MKRIPGSGGLASDPRVHLVFLIFFGMTVFFAKLGINGMANYDDCFYGQKAKEILENGEWWLVTYNHKPAFENPPLYFWLEACSYKLFGISVYGAKFPSALMGFLSVILVYFFGKFLFNPLIGLYSAFILASSYPFFKYGRHAMVDSTLTFFTMLALFALVLALRKDRRFFLLWGFSTGLGVLTKSVLGFFPLVIAVCFLVVSSRARKLLDPFFLIGCGILAVVGGSWYALEYQAFGEAFLKVHFGWLIFERGMKEPLSSWLYFFSYFKELATFYWPWLPLCGLGIVMMVRSGLKRDENALFVFLWAFVVLGVMSAMRVHMLWYILPAFPALAMIGGYALNRLAAPPKGEKLARNLMWTGFSIALLLNFLPYALDRDRERDIRVLAPYVKHFAQRGAMITGFREGFHDINNALLFFSDHAAEPLYKEVADLKKAFSSKRLMVCLAHRKDLELFREAAMGFYPVKFAQDRILISNQPFESIEVKALGDSWEK